MCADLQIVYCSTVLDLDMEITRRTFDVHYFGVIALVQAFSPLLILAKGTIINIGSMSAMIDSPYMGAYGGSKVSMIVSDVMLYRHT